MALCHNGVVRCRGQEAALSRTWLAEMQARRAPPLVNHKCIDSGEGVAAGMLTFLQAKAEVADLSTFDIFAGVKTEDRKCAFFLWPRTLADPYL